MPWFGYSLIATFITSWYAIGQKWAINLKIDKIKLLTYVFIGLAVCYIFYSFVIHDGFSSFLNLMRSPMNIILALAVAGLSFGGNILDLNALEKSPNPGYVQGIKVTSSILVVIFSAIFLDSPITWQKFLGIVVVILGLVLIILEKNQTKKSSASWKLPAVLAMILFGAMMIVVKAMTNRGFAPDQVLTILFLFAAVGFLAVSYFKKIGLGLTSTPKIIIIPILIVIAIAFFSNLLNFTAIKMVPNPGYSTAVFNSSVVLTLFISPLVFPKGAGGEINLRNWLGVFITIGGVILVILG